MFTQCQPNSPYYIDDEPEVYNMDVALAALDNMIKSGTLPFEMQDKMKKAS